MLIDFSLLKKIVFEGVLESFDHSLVLSDESPLELFKILQEFHLKINKLEFQPTCENLVTHFSGKLQKAFPEHIELLGLKLHEISDSYAEWKKKD